MNVTSTGTGWPDPDIQAEFDAVVKEALAGRMPFTRLRLAERVVEVARAHRCFDHPCRRHAICQALDEYDADDRTKPEAP